MSKIRAYVVEIIGSGGLHIVRFRHFQHTLTMVGLELPDVRVGSEVMLNIKSSSVGIAKNYRGDFSFSNCLSVKVVSIDMGGVLCVLTLETAPHIYIESLLTAYCAKKMELREDEIVDALFEASEVSICEIFS